MTVLLDSGAFIALERNDRAMWTRLKSAQLSGQVPITHGGVIAQVWRGLGPRQALLAKALAGVDVRALDDTLGRITGELLARVKSGDVVDAALVALATGDDQLVTSDPDDLAALVTASGREIDVVPT
jgi:hypothetical protein